MLERENEWGGLEICLTWRHEHIIEWWQTVWQSRAWWSWPLELLQRAGVSVWVGRRWGGQLLRLQAVGEGVQVFHQETNHQHVLLRRAEGFLKRQPVTKCYANTRHPIRSQFQKAANRNASQSKSSKTIPKAQSIFCLIEYRGLTPMKHLVLPILLRETEPGSVSEPQEFKWFCLLWVLVLRSARSVSMNLITSHLDVSSENSHCVSSRIRFVSSLFN